MPNRKPHRVVDLLRHFRRLGAAVDLPRPEDLDDLIPPRAHGGLLLDFYAPEDVRAALDRYGIAHRLAERGFGELSVELDTSDPERQVVRVDGRREGSGPLRLGEAFLHAGSFASRAPFAGVQRDRPVPMLFIQWLRLQDPTRPFSPERPPLPGQEHPGLGIGREVMAMFLGLAERLGFHGIMACPEFVHNAVFYAWRFRFFDPEAHGRFEALREATRGLGLAELAWAVEGGRVVDAATGEPLRWRREEMLCATRPPVTALFDSADWREACDRARVAARYRCLPAEAEPG